MLRTKHSKTILPLFRQNGFLRTSCILLVLQITFFSILIAVVNHAVPSISVMGLCAALGVVSSVAISAVITAQTRPYRNATAILEAHYEDSNFVNYSKKDGAQSHFIETAVKTLLADVDIIQKEHARLTSLLSHDVRTPLSQVISLCALLEDEQDPMLREQYLQYIKSQSYEMLDMLTDTLYLMQAAGVQIKRTDVTQLELSKAIKTVMQLLASQMQNKQISIIQDIPHKLKVLAEEKRFTLAVVQLLANAIKLSPPNGVIDIKARIISSGKVIICISNYDEQNEKFAQACDAFDAVPLERQITVTRKKPSLYLADRIIAKHNGDLVLQEEGDSQYFYQMRVPVCAN